MTLRPNRTDTTISVSKPSSTLARRLAAQEGVMIQRLIQAALEHYLSRYDPNVQAALTSGLGKISPAGAAAAVADEIVSESCASSAQNVSDNCLKYELTSSEIKTSPTEFYYDNLQIDLGDLCEIDPKELELDISEVDVEALLAELGEPSEIKFEDYDLDALLAALDKLE